MNIRLSLDRARRCLHVLVAVLAVHAVQAGAQTPSDPTLNAQLLLAARQNDLPQVERVLSQGEAPNSRNRLGKTPLLMACEKGNLPLASRMLGAGVDDLCDNRGQTALDMARAGGHTAAAALLSAPP